MRPHRFFSLVVTLLILLPASTQAASTAALVEQGNACYGKGKYEDALRAYDQAFADAPGKPRVLFDKGAAYYRMGQYAKAKSAWEKTAIKSEDPRLEAKAFFNLGNCVFRQAGRQEDILPQKAIADCTRSVEYYQQSLDLLKKRTDSEGFALKKNASENIEMVRLTMKSILDKLRKKQEQEKNQEAEEKQAQKEANAVKKLITKQQGLINRDKYLEQDQQSRKELKALKKHTTQMARDQASLQKETKDAAKELTSSKAKKPDLEKAAGKRLQQAQNFQKKAVNQIKKGRLPDAGKNQQAALGEMKKALSSLEKGAGKNGHGKQAQTGRQQASSTGRRRKHNATQTARLQGQPNHAEKQQQHAQNRNSAIDQMLGTAQSIIDQEQQNREELRQQMTASQGGYQAVGKDW